jgi:hypothetical protein
LHSHLCYQKRPSIKASEESISYTLTVTSLCCILFFMLHKVFIFKYTDYVKNSKLCTKYPRDLSPNLRYHLNFCNPLTTTHSYLIVCPDQVIKLGKSLAVSLHVLPASLSLETTKSKTFFSPMVLH